MMSVSVVVLSYLCLLLLYSTTHQTKAQFSDVCVWGRNSTETYSNNFINGLYRFESNYSNGFSETHPYYKLDLSSVADCSASYLFLFYGDDRTWTVTANLGDTSAVYAICIDPAADTPEECSATWNISTETGYKFDENVELFAGNCPVLHCSSLSFDSSAAIITMIIVGL
jgi:hypothetical protein